MRRNWKKILVIIVLVAVVVLFVRNSTNSSNKKAVTYTVKRQDLQEVLSLSGHVDASEHVVLRFQTAGQIAWVGVKEGDYVKKYQTVASLDQQALKKQLQKTLNNYLKSRDSFDQNKDDYKDKVITDEIKRIANDSQQDLNNSVIDVELQDLTLRYSNLWSPIEGIVTRVDSPVAGINISVPTQAEFEVINPKTIYFSAVADQTDVININEGMTGTLSLDSYPNANIKGSITKIGFTPKSGETGTVYAVEIMLDNNDLNSYRFGMTGDVNFILKEKKGVLSLPKNLVKDDNGKKYVYLFVQGKGVRRDVVTGQTIDNQTEIESGISQNDVVVNQP